MAKESKEAKEYVGFKAEPDMVNVIDHLAFEASDVDNRKTRSDVIREMIEQSAMYRRKKRELEKQEAGRAAA